MKRVSTTRSIIEIVITMTIGAAIGIALFWPYYVHAQDTRYQMRVTIYKIVNGHLVPAETFEAVTRDEPTCKKHRDAIVRERAEKGDQVIGGCRPLGSRV